MKGDFTQRETETNENVSLYVHIAETHSLLSSVSLSVKAQCGQVPDSFTVKRKLLVVINFINYVQYIVTRTILKKHTQIE